MDKAAQRIIRNNLVGLLIAVVGLGLLGKFVSQGAVVLFGALFLGQMTVNLLLGLSSLFSRTSDGNAAPYFLSMLLVLLIGFGACAGMMSLTDFRLE